jgi:hypothetical protein
MRGAKQARQFHDAELADLLSQSFPRIPESSKSVLQKPLPVT